MDDLISRAAACDEIGKMIHEYREEGDHDLADALILSRRYVLKQLPTIDAIPVKWLFDWRDRALKEGMNPELVEWIEYILQIWSREKEDT